MKFDVWCAPESSMSMTFLSKCCTPAAYKCLLKHAIVFDEAQRAWDERQGLKKFSRTASEPALLLQVMGLRRDGCACVCLVGGGQEINSGERGVAGWGDAIRSLTAEDVKSWVVFGPPDVLSGGPSTGGDSIGELPSGVDVRLDDLLQLEVPLRSHLKLAKSLRE